MSISKDIIQSIVAIAKIEEVAGQLYTLKKKRYSHGV